ncbi:aspartate ammonia-lyase [bacterium]|nr:aspartate ammonia-lyase [bacterium]
MEKKKKAKAVKKSISAKTTSVKPDKRSCGSVRKEKDLLGEKSVPNDAYYGIQTLRGLENFNISGITLNFFPIMISSFAIVKKAAAKANYDLGLIEKPVFNAIVKACDEIIAGKLNDHFPIDMIQGGAGTTTNMNANEVVANRALEIMGKKRGEYQFCHPNNHVNLSQSTNDVYPTAAKIAIIKKNQLLIDVLKELISSFRKKGKEFASVIKIGRTQLQDAVPMTLGQSFEAYAVTLEEEVLRLEENAKLFLEVNMGATAIGTGINSDPGYAKKVVSYLKEITKLKIVSAKNLIEATQDAGSFVMYSSALKRTAIKLSKICDDLRLLSSGPRAGFNEINLPPMQPGSSIMPGKVNPVIPEVVNQIAFKVIGNDLTVSLAAAAGQLELNVMLPVVTQSIFESIDILKNGMDTLKTRCVDGITANVERCKELVYNSIGLLTALNPVLGYDVSNKLAKEASETNKGIYQLILEKKLLKKEELEELLKPENMIAPKKLVKKSSKKR